MYIYNYIYIVPVKILYMWVVAIVTVIAFGGPLSLSRVFCGNQHIRDPTWSQTQFLNRFGNGSRSCLLVSGASATLNVPFILHAFSFIFLSFACIPFILHSFPVIFLSFSFNVPFIYIHYPSFPFIFLSFHSNVDSCPFIFLSLAACSFHCAFMSFLKLWKWLYGLARGPSATHGCR